MQYPASELVIDPVLIREYDVDGPRYTSYPTADRFVDAFGEAQFRQWLARRNIGGINQPLSIYVHLPICNKSSKYIKYLEKELALIGPLAGADRQICRLHWGGGTPALFAREELTQLMRAIDAQFERAPIFECSVELDPRSAPAGTLARLGELGFNHVCIAAQSELTRSVIEEARASGFRSVSLDLVYGLHKQTLDSFSRTLDKIIALAPDRIALRGSAHLSKLPPSPEAKLQILTLAIGRLTRAGYLYIGMEHFAKANDELAIAQAQGRLQHNFQGYSTHPAADMLGFGVAAIGNVGPTYYQNRRVLQEYYAELDAGRLPVSRGVELTQDDLVRRAVIQALSCHFRVSIESIELAHLIEFSRYFAAELADLRRFADDGLLELTPDWIVVTPKGRLMVGAVCKAFDRYLREREVRAAYSKVI